jgi:hypothetical protein
MAVYLANRIIAGALDYTLVVTRRPDLKTDIDAFLITQGRADLIV